MVPNSSGGILAPHSGEQYTFIPALGPYNISSNLLPPNWLESHENQQFLGTGADELEEDPTAGEVNEENNGESRGY